MFPDYRVKTAFQHGKGVIDKKVPFKNNKRLKKNIIYRLFRNTADPKGASTQPFQKRAPRRAQISKSYDNHTIPVSGGQRGKRPPRGGG